MTLGPSRLSATEHCEAFVAHVSERNVISIISVDRSLHNPTLCWVGSHGSAGEAAGDCPASIVTYRL